MLGVLISFIDYPIPNTSKVRDTNQTQKTYVKQTKIEA